jgi:D-lactate dehydrogenase (cytochrome)
MIATLTDLLGEKVSEKPALFLEFHSSTGTAIEEESALAERLARDAGALDINIARNEQERSDQWEARHNFAWAFMRCNPGCVYYTTDTAVPLSRVTELVTYAQHLLKEMHLEGSIIGHIGDGNFHTLTLPYPRSMRELNPSLSGLSNVPWHSAALPEANTA